MLRCKPGDLAVVVAVDAATCEGSTPNEYGLDAFTLIAADFRGVIVKCISSTIEEGEALWNIEQRRARYVGVMTDGRRIEAVATVTQVPDRVLRPIRDSDGEDEMLRIVGKPEPVAA